LLASAIDMNCNECDNGHTGYTIKVDCANKKQWNKIILNFADATIYQTWSYGAVRWGTKNISHIVLKKGEEVLAAVQIRIISVPLIGPIIAYVTRGPMWRRWGTQRDIDIFRQVIRALRQEYVQKRRLYLRILPNEFEGQSDDVSRVLDEENFCRQSSVPPYRTLLNDLTLSLEDLRKGFYKNWRKNLGRAERNNLEVREGHDGDMYRVFMNLYREMADRKRFLSRVDIEEFEQIQNDLPDNQKMNIFICEDHADAVAALVWSMIGDTAITVLSATGNKGMESYASYLLMWRLFERLKEKNARVLDQCGIDREKNPGGYSFKSGMGGIEAIQIGQYDAYVRSPKVILIRCSEKLRACWQKTKHTLLLKGRKSFKR